MPRKIPLLSLLSLLSVLLIVALLTPLSPTRAQDDPGGIGDPFYPQLGNRGYDVVHYTIDLAADVDRNAISGATTIEALTLDADLDSFHLDLVGLTVEDVAVNGAAATWTREPHELIVTPQTPLPAGSAFTVAVTYGGVPEGVQMSGIPFLAGWVNYGGGVFVASEPGGAASWYPVNDHPLDKATYTFRITVPQPYVVAANGVLTETVVDGAQTTYVWEMVHPMASYLATVNVDEFERVEEEGPNGLLIRNYFPPAMVDAATREFAKTADMIAFYESVFGPYPFDAYGVVVADAGFPFALETQSLSLFSRSWITGNGSAEEAVAHELSHQWFGDSVTPANWRDVWLNEGFATYASWLWFEHVDGPTRLHNLAANTYNQIAADQQGYIVRLTKRDLLLALEALPLADYTLSSADVAALVRTVLSDAASAEEIDALVAGFPAADIAGEELLTLMQALPFQVVLLRGDELHALKALLGLDAPLRAGLLIPESSYVAPGNPPSDDLFNQGVYKRGGLTLHALRLRVGDEAFFNILATYYERYRNGNASTDDFVATAEEISGQDLGAFFDAWLYSAPLPDLPEMSLSAGG